MKKDVEFCPNCRHVKTVQEAYERYICEYKDVMTNLSHPHYVSHKGYCPNYSERIEEESQ